MAHRYKSILSLCLILAAVAAAAGCCLWRSWPRHRVELLFRVDALAEQGPMVEEVRAVIQRRLRAHGASRSSVRAHGKNHIAVRLTRREPSYVGQIRATIENLGYLEFRLVAEVGPVETWKRTGKAPAGYHEYQLLSLKQGEKEFTREAILISDRAEMTGKYISGAHVSTAGTGLRPTIILTFTPLAEQKFGRLTGANIKRRLAIILNTRRAPDGGIVDKGRCYSAPVIESAVFGNVQICGNSDLAEARRLRSILMAGSLPAPVVFVRQTNLASR